MLNFGSFTPVKCAYFSFVWIINDLGHFLHALEKGELTLILWNNTQHFISAREEPQPSEALAHVR